MPSISIFVNGRSFLLFEVLGLRPADLQFLNRPVQSWSEDDVYRKVSSFVNNLKVVNDPAER